MSFVQGEEIFRARSELNVPANVLLALLSVIVTTIVGVAFFNLVDGRFVGSTLVSQAIVMIVGLVIISQMIVNRAAFQARWGARAFSIAFRWMAIPGLTLIGVGLAHLAWIEGARILSREIVLIPYLYLLATGLALWARALLVFGIDNLSMMYVYYPAESRLVDSKIYGVLRHPVYSAAQRVAFALVLWNGSAFALFAGLMVPVTMYVWVRLVEERELIERFSDSYREYRARVPAFFNFDPRAWLVLWRFLLTGK